jgi:phage/plasmid-associated DNA primase
VKDQNYSFSTEESEAVKKESRRFEEDSSSVMRFAREFGYVHDPSNFLSASLIYNEYKDWCLAGGMKFMSINNFGKDFSRAVPGSESTLKKMGGEATRMRPVRREMLGETPVPVEQMEF